jgi:hypothetical protein
MSSSVATGRIRLTENPDVLKKLRRLAKGENNINGTCAWRKNAAGQEYYSVMFDGMSIPFYVGQTRDLPLSWAQSIASVVMPMDEKLSELHEWDVDWWRECPRCKGIGLRDSNIERPLFKLLSQTDEAIFDPNSYQSAPPVSTETEKALTA